MNDSNSRTNQSNGVTIVTSTHTSKKGHTYKRRRKEVKPWNAPTLRHAYVGKLVKLFKLRRP